MTLQNVIAVGGVPGTGKSTLMKAFQSSLKGQWESAKPVPTLDVERSTEHSLEVLGRYQNEGLFSGTDKLSMAVQPKAIEYLTSEDCPNNIVFEGDRLFNLSFLSTIEEMDNVNLMIIVLKANEQTLQCRYDERGSDQSDKFIRGRYTKQEKILSSFDLMPYTNEIPHETNEDTQYIISTMHDFLGVD